MRRILYVTIPLIVLMLVVQVFTTRWYININQGLYESHNQVEDIYIEASDVFMGYLNYRYDSLDALEGELYDVEIKHMADVRVVFTGFRVTAIVFAIISLIVIIREKDKAALYMVLIKALLYPLGIMGILGALMMIDFSATFTTFHEILFNNDDWLLPYNSLLIQMLPLEFWFNTGVRIVVAYSLLSVSLAYDFFYLRKRLT
jgi:integral membrane protein (TIGR01906 family)